MCIGALRNLKTRPPAAEIIRLTDQSETVSSLQIPGFGTAGMYGVYHYYQAYFGGRLPRTWR